VGKIQLTYLLYFFALGTLYIGSAVAVGCICGPGGYYCQENEYCVADPVNGDYDCVSCGSGYVPNGSCTACEVAPVTYCSGYDGACPAGVGAGMKCKAVAGCESPCQKYDVCNPSNGNITTAISGQCHLEGNSCYPNSRACSDFDVSVIGGTGNWTCKKEDQTGVAQWMTVNNEDYFWSVSACSCNTDITNISSSTGCAVGRVEHELAQHNINSVTKKIPYIQIKRYCKECAPGKVPQKADAPFVQYTYTEHPYRWYSSNQNTAWGSYSCKNVSKPKYSDGCTVRFDMSYSAAVAFCEKSCDSRMETQSDGATSVAACKPDDTIYEDSVGKFTLGDFRCQ
jgi:hypothetical protein